MLSAPSGCARTGYLSHLYLASLWDVHISLRFEKLVACAAEFSYSHTRKHVFRKGIFILKRRLTSPFIAVTLISALALTSCAEKDGVVDNEKEPSFNSADSNPDNSIPDNIVTDNRNDVDLSPYIMKAKTTKIADLPEGEATRGLQFLDGRVIGHAMTDKDTGASRVYSVDADGNDYKIEKDFGSLIEEINKDHKFEYTDVDKSVIDPDGYGLTVYQEPGSDDYVLYTQYYFSKGGDWYLEAKRTNNDKYDEDYISAKVPRLQFNAINSCLDPKMMEEAGHYIGFTTGAGSSSNLMLNIGDPDSSYTPADDPEIELSSGSTTDDDDSTLKGITDCGFAGNFLVTNVRNHYDIRKGTTPDGNANPELKHRAHLTLSLPLTGDKHRKTTDGLPVDYATSYLVDLEGIDPNKDVTALAIDPDDPDTAYVTVEGDNGLYKVDISSAQFGGHSDGYKFLDDMYARVSGKK